MTRSMNVDIVYYRAMIGLFNTIKIKGCKISPTMIEELMCTFTCIYTCLSWFICKCLAVIFFPFCMALFLILNLLFPFKSVFHVSDDFTIFQATIQMYIHVSINFAHIIISHNMLTLLSNVKIFTVDWSFSKLLRLATMLAYLVLLGGNVHKNPGPLSICHWNLGGLPTDNFLKKFLLQAFL